MKEGRTPRIVKGREVGVPATAHGVWVRGIKHFTECLVAMYPDSAKDEKCTCMDWSPELMSASLQSLVVHGSTARRGGRVVARLRWSGKVITVIPAGTGKPAGRLVPEGYLSGRPDDGSGRYDAWTAKHPLVHTPSDRELRTGLPLADAVASLLA